MLADVRSANDVIAFEGKYGTARPADNIYIGAAWEGQRAMGAVWPNDVTSKSHYHRLLTALFNPIGFFRLVMDLAALRIFGFRIEKMHGPATFAFIFLFGGFGGHGLEAAVAPAWLLTGAAPGLMALYCALLCDIVIQRKKLSGSIVDVVVVISFIAFSLVLAPIPGSGVWAAFGGALFGLAAKGVTAAAQKTKHCEDGNRWKWWVLLAFFVCACAGLIAMIVTMLNMAKGEQLCPTCMNVCYDVACWCDPTRRLAIDTTAAFTPAQVSFFRNTSKFSKM